MSTKSIHAPESVGQSSELSIVEIAKLENFEEIIEAGRQAFVDVARALMAINSERLYRATHATFELYCRERWGFEKAHAYRLIAAAEVVENLQTSPNGDVLPANESQTRPLAKLEPDEQREAWQEAVDESGGKPTARHVEAAVERRRRRTPEPYEHASEMLEGVNNAIGKAYERTPEAMRPVLADVLDARAEELRGRGSIVESTEAFNRRWKRQQELLSMPVPEHYGSWHDRAWVAVGAINNPNLEKADRDHHRQSMLDMALKLDLLAGTNWEAQAVVEVASRESAATDAVAIASDMSSQLECFLSEALRIVDDPATDLKTLAIIIRDLHDIQNMIAERTIRAERACGKLLLERKQQSTPEGDAK